MLSCLHQFQQFLPALRLCIRSHPNPKEEINRKLSSSASGYSVLHLAIRWHGNSTELIEMLLEEGADPNQTDDFGTNVTLLSESYTRH